MSFVREIVYGVEEQRGYVYRYIQPFLINTDRMIKFCLLQSMHYIFTSIHYKHRKDMRLLTDIY